MQHCQVPELTVGGVMNEGFESMRLGLAGMPAAAEDIMVARDIRLAEITGGRLHIQHISTARSVELVREGKRRGVRVTAEACPHHFTLTDERLRTFDSNFKMNPPLRTWSDVEAVIGGLKDGTIEMLATDHAPHAPEKKMRELDQAPFGIVGLETLIPITVTRPDRAGPPDLARGDPQAHDQPGAAPRHPQGNAPPGRRRRRDHHRPRGALDDRPDPVPLQEPQHALRRLGSPRPRPHGDRRRRGPLHPRRHRPAPRRAVAGLIGMACGPGTNQGQLILEFVPADGAPMRYLIDGYNVMYAGGLLDGKRLGSDGFRQARTRFLNDLADALGPVDAHQTTVVFDAAAAPEGFANETQHKGLSVVYAVDDENADARIERLIAAHASPRTLAVVSSDHRIRQAATRRKALAVTADDFWVELDARKEGGSRPAEVAGIARGRGAFPRPETLAGGIGVLGQRVPGA